MSKPLREGQISEDGFVGVVFLAVFVIFLASVAPKAQSFKSRIDIVQVTVTVSDAEGRLITGLTKDDFQIFEDGDRQDITQFTDARVPVSLGVLLDASDSMRGQPIVDARDAVDRFVGDLLLGEDEALVATFNHLPRLAAPWTMPPSRTKDSLASLKPSGGTAIYDALASTSKLFEQRNHVRAAMVVISDGADTASDRLAPAGARRHSPQRRARVCDCDRLGRREGKHTSESGSAAGDHEPYRWIHRGGAQRRRSWSRDRSHR